MPLAASVPANVGDCESEPEAAPPASSALASPKSSTFTRSSGVTTTFAGFRSRWTTPCSCAASSAIATWRAISSASRTGTAPRAMRFARSSPGTYSIAR